MSAFFVGLPHINAMLSVAELLARGMTLPDPTRDPHPIRGTYYQRTYAAKDVLDRIGLALQTENALSLEARYPTDWHQMLPEGLDLTRFDYQPDHWFSTCATPADIFNLVGCYEYQACEHDAWDKSYAHAFCEWLFATAARKVPEGKLRTWNYEGPPADAPRVYSLTHLMGRGF